MSTQTTFKSVYRPITKVIDEVLTSGVLNFSGRTTSIDFTANQTKTFYSLINIQHFTNNQIVIISNRSSEDITLSPYLMVANKTIIVKPNTASIFIYLLSEQKLFDVANSAQFDELQLIINSIDLDVISLQTLTSNHEEEINTLKDKVTALEVEQGNFSQNDFLFIKEKIIINSQSQLSYIDLQHQAVPNSIFLSIDRFVVQLNQDFTTSIENGVTRLTWVNELASPSGEEKVELNDVVFITYKVPNLQKIDLLYKKENIMIETQSQLSYIDLEYNAVPNTIVVSINRLMVFLNEDFTISNLNGKTRLTWSGSLISSSSGEQIQLNDKVFINYKIPNNFYS